MILTDIGNVNRQMWLRAKLSAIPPGQRILDAGAGEMLFKPFCSHLHYVSQDFCQYQKGNGEGLHADSWDTTHVDIVSDITAIPKPDASFDAILCTEVFEHIPDPGRALDEFARLLRPGGTLILTAPFGSLVHMAPYHYCSGFSRYWYEYHLPRRGLQIQELMPNGDWHTMLRQEITRLGGLERRDGCWLWPLAYIYAALGLAYFRLRGAGNRSDLSCFGWYCVAKKQ